MRDKDNARKGVILIVVLAVLVILSLIALVFARLATMERTTSRAYVDLVRAKMYAQSGIHYAVTHTRALLGEQGFDTDFIYYGEDLNGNKQFDGGLEDQDGDGKFQTYNCPLKRAVRPSYMKNLNGDKNSEGKDILDENDLIEVRGKKIGVSNFLPGTYKDHGDFYAVRVEDLSAKIYVNMVDHPHMEEILQNLAEEAGLDRSVGTKIFTSRGTEGYTNIKELESKAGLTKTQAEIMSQYLTVHAWCDKSMVKAVPLEERLGSTPASPLRLGQDIYTWEQIRPKKINYPRDPSRGPYGETVGRAPVNINTASKEVLVALIRGLQGFYLNEGALLRPITTGYDMINPRYAYYTYSGGSGGLGKMENTPQIDRAKAQMIADSIIANREIKEENRTPNSPWEGRFRTWEQFRHFCDEVLWLGQGRAPHRGIISAQQADVLKANFNPNSNINDFNPDFHRMFWVDKTDLTYFTTEFTFYPLGYFAIDSIGRILGKDDQVMAEAEINTIVQLFEIYRETTQKDFLYEYWNDNKPIRETISPNNGISKTTNELGLQTYPEILDKDYVRDAEYDGYISLATVEHEPTGASFIAHYSQNRLNADNAPKPELVPDIKGPKKDRLVLAGTQDVINWQPGKLFPDGVYSETESVPMYNYRPSDLNVFAASLWVKPHFFPESAAKIRVYLTFQSPMKTGGWRFSPLGLYNIANRPIESRSEGGYYYAMSPFGLEGWDNASFMAGGCGATGNKEWEGGVGTPCLNHLGHGHDTIIRCGQSWPTLFRAGKWLHLGWVRDARPDKTRAYRVPFGQQGNIYNLDSLLVNGLKTSGPFGAGANDVSSPGEYYVPDNILRLGERKTQGCLNSAPDSTIDEVILWEGLTMTEAEQKIREIWREGRYYKENDGVFTSRTIDLAKISGLSSDAPVTLFLAAWTQYRPDTLPDEATCEVAIVGENKEPLTETRYLRNSAGSLIKAYGGGPLTVTAPFRYQVYFRPSVGLNDIVVDSLIFDDITLIYYTNPKFLSWTHIQQ